MTSESRFSAVFIISTFLVGCGGKTATQSKSSNTAAGNAPAAQSISVTRSVSLPARMVPDPSQPLSSPAVLTITQSGEDEPSEGPSTFDVRPDKGFVIADPLRNRVVFYDAQGRYEQELVVYISPEHLRVLPNNALSVVRYHTGERYIYDADSSGHYKAPRLANASDPDPDAEDRGDATLENAQSAVLRPLPHPGQEIPPIAIRFNRPGEQMVSVRRLGSDDHGHTYVVIESSPQPDSNVVAVETDIQKYTRGREAGEIAGISSDYAVHPEDPFRVRDGFIYQMVPKASEVRINIWDTNSIP